MRHRHTTGAGPSGARPSIVVLLLIAAGGGLTAGFGQPGGVWAGYGTASVAALVGCGTLWQQRGLMERHAKEMAKRRRGDLEEAAVTARRHQIELERLRIDLEHERQYSGLIQDQLTRTRDQLDKERAARRAAERELDTVTGAARWPAAKPSVVLTVEEPLPNREAAEQVTSDAAVKSDAVFKSDAVKGEPANSGMSAAQRRGWQILDGDGADETDAIGGGSIDARSIHAVPIDDESIDAVADLLYRPFIDQLAAVTVPVSDAALAMAPVIAAVDHDDILDLTAYDETVEFAAPEMKRLAGS